MVYASKGEKYFRAVGQFREICQGRLSSPICPWVDLFSILEITQPFLSNPVLLDGFKVMVTINSTGEFLYIVKVEFDNSISYGDSKIFAFSFIEDNLIYLRSI